MLSVRREKVELEAEAVGRVTRADAARARILRVEENMVAEGWLEVSRR